MNTAVQSVVRRRWGIRLRGHVDRTRVASIAAFFGLWQAVSMYNQARHLFNPVFLPSPTMVIAAGAALYQRGELQQDILQSTARLLAGFGCGAAAGVLVGILLARSKRLESVIDGHEVSARPHRNGELLLQLQWRHIASAFQRPARTGPVHQNAPHHVCAHTAKKWVRHSQSGSGVSTSRRYASFTRAVAWSVWPGRSFAI